MIYKITLNLQKMDGWTIVTSWKLVNEFLNLAFEQYGDIMLGYKIESIKA